MRFKDLYAASVELAEKELMKRLPYQVTDPDSADLGGVYDERLGRCSAQAGVTVGLVEWACWAYCCPDSSRFCDGELVERVRLAMDYQARNTRPSGFVDLCERNYDSPPDTAFACGWMGRAIWYTRCWKLASRAGELEEAIRPVYLRCVRALADHGGFHTPNHRWVIVGVLSQAQELYPELTLRPVIDSYLAEGIDLNDAGLYSEKSFGYSAEINNRLLDFWYAFREEWILDKILRNCNGIVDMMNADSTVLTNISLRQDNGLKFYPTNFIRCFYTLGHYRSAPRLFSAIATMLRLGRFDAPDLVYVFSREPGWIGEETEAEPLREDYEKLFRDVGIWKWKQGDLSVTAMTGQTGVLSFQFGDVSIPEIGMHAPYFTAQKYTCDTIEPTDAGVTMLLQPTYGAGQELLMPGYWKTLGRPVPFEDLPYNNLAERTRIPRPDVAYRWTIERKPDGFDLVVASEGGMERVYAEVEFTINLPGVLITENGYEALQTSRAYQLRAGYVTFRSGLYAVTLGPGSFENNNVLLTIPQEKNVLKVIVSGALPMEHRFELRCFKLDGRAPEAYRSVLR